MTREEKGMIFCNSVCNSIIGAVKAEGKETVADIILSLCCEFTGREFKRPKSDFYDIIREKTYCRWKKNDDKWTPEAVEEARKHALKGWAERRNTHGSTHGSTLPQDNTIKNSQDNHQHLPYIPSLTLPTSQTEKRKRGRPRKARDDSNDTFPSILENADKTTITQIREDPVEYVQMLIDERGNDSTKDAMSESNLRRAYSLSPKAFKEEVAYFTNSIYKHHEGPTMKSRGAIFWSRLRTRYKTYGIKL